MSDQFSFRPECVVNCHNPPRLQFALAMAEERRAHATELLDLVEASDLRILGSQIEQGAHMRLEIEAALAAVVARGIQPPDYAEAMLERLDAAESEHVPEVALAMYREINADLAYHIAESAFEGVVKGEIDQAAADEVFEQNDKEAEVDTQLETELAELEARAADQPPAPTAAELHDIIEQETEAITDLQLMLAACATCRGPKAKGFGKNKRFECRAKFEAEP